MGDVAHLTGQVTGHRVDVVGQVFPGARRALYLRLPPQLAVGADLACYPCDLASERIQLIHHGVDGVFQVQNLAFDIHSDFSGQIPGRHRFGDIGDVTHLTGQVTGHRVDVVGQVFPGARRALYLRLPPQLAVGADLACYPCDLASERIQLIHHGVDGVFQVQNLAFDIHGDFSGEVPGRHRLGHFGDVTHLTGEISGHRVDVVGQIFPGAAYTFHLGLPTQFAIGADLACYSRDL